jgi:hypothetical protein
VTGARVPHAQPPVDVPGPFAPLRRPAAARRLGVRAAVRPARGLREQLVIVIRVQIRPLRVAQDHLDRHHLGRHHLDRHHLDLRAQLTAPHVLAQAGLPIGARPQANGGSQVDLPRRPLRVVAARRKAGPRVRRTVGPRELRQIALLVTMTADRSVILVRRGPKNAAPLRRTLPAIGRQVVLTPAAAMSVRVVLTAIGRNKAAGRNAQLISNRAAVAGSRRRLARSTSSRADRVHPVARRSRSRPTPIPAFSIRRFGLSSGR